MGGVDPPRTVIVPGVLSDTDDGEGDARGDGMVDAALAEALTLAARAGEWNLAAQLLEALRRRSSIRAAEPPMSWLLG